MDQAPSYDSQLKRNEKKPLCFIRCLYCCYCSTIYSMSPVLAGCTVFPMAGQVEELALFVEIRLTVGQKQGLGKLPFFHIPAPTCGEAKSKVWGFLSGFKVYCSNTWLPCSNFTTSRGSTFMCHDQQSRKKKKNQPLSWKQMCAVNGETRGVWKIALASVLLFHYAFSLNLDSLVWSWKSGSYLRKSITKCKKKNILQTKPLPRSRRLIRGC